MLYSMRVRNLRSFSGDELSPYIDLKPLTVLIGKNSSGKSSFLRTFPLLRQSVESKTSGPILWYGSYVDFGAFSEAKVRDSEINTIYFDFKLRIKIAARERFPWDHYRWSDPALNGLNDELDVVVHLGVSESGKKTVLSYLKIFLSDGISYEFNFDNAGKCGFLINDMKVAGVDSLNYIASSGLIPTIGLALKRERDFEGKKKIINVFNERFFDHFYSAKIGSLVKNFSRGSTSQKTIDECIEKLGVYKKEDILDSLKSIFKRNTTFVKNLSLYKELICPPALEMCMHRRLSEIIKGINGELELAFKSVRYIAPLRATAERYYRYQDLQINEIDHTGSNLAMLLRSFSASDNEKFSEWTLDNFGFKVKVEELGLHCELKIQTDNDTKEYNINDMGFGFSQMLPIIASIWMETNSNKKGGIAKFSPKRFIFTIEQPELHLHPEYQSRLARMFASVVKSAKQNSVDLVIVFETHSKTMINTLGDCIEENLILDDDVNIAIFEKEIGEDKTKINFSSFDADGNLKEWPLGFFSGRS